MFLTGGWYALSGAPSFKVPSKDVVLFNNLVYNPANESAKWAHFSVSASPNSTGHHLMSPLLFYRPGRCPGRYMHCLSSI